MLITPAMEDVDLRDWKKFDEAVASGYEATVAALRAQPMFGKAEPVDLSKTFFGPAT
jgi:hypothetical protein